MNIKVSMEMTPSSMSGPWPLMKKSRDQIRTQRMMVSVISMNNLCQTHHKQKRKICIIRMLRMKRKTSKSSRKRNKQKKVSNGGPPGDSKKYLIMDSMNLSRRHRQRKMMSKIGMHSKIKKMILRILKKRKNHQRSMMMKVLIISKSERYRNHHS